MHVYVFLKMNLICLKSRKSEYELESLFQKIGLYLDFLCHFSRNNTCFLLDWEKKTNEPRGQ